MSFLNNYVACIIRRTACAPWSTHFCTPKVQRTPPSIYRYDGPVLTSARIMIISPNSIASIICGNISYVSRTISWRTAISWTGKSRRALSTRTTKFVETGLEFPMQRRRIWKASGRQQGTGGQFSISQTLVWVFCYFYTPNYSSNCSN